MHAEVLDLVRLEVSRGAAAGEGIVTALEGQLIHTVRGWVALAHQQRCADLQVVG